MFLFGRKFVVWRSAITVVIPSSQQPVHLMMAGLEKKFFKDTQNFTITSVSESEFSSIIEE
jgi:hypothetical protein